MRSELRYFKPKKLHKYPHLYGEDALCLDSYWNINCLNLRYVAYDVAIGGYHPRTYSAGYEFDNDWSYLSSFKIDMVGWTDDNIYIVEVKHNGAPAAIGQLLVYSELFSEMYFPKVHPKMVLLCFNIKDSVVKVAEEHNIKIIQVGPPPDSRYFDDGGGVII